MDVVNSIMPLGEVLMNSRIVMMVALAAGLPAQAPADEARGLRSVSVGYEQIHIDGGYQGDQFGRGIEVDGQSLVLGAVYGFDEHWSLAVSLPFTKRQYTGFLSHDPAILPAPFNRAPTIDDGKHHGSWADYRIGLSYTREHGGWTFAPYLAAYIPSHDYPHFGNAAVGQNLWKLQAGGRIAYLLERAPLYWAADLSFVHVEETLGVNVDHWIADLSVGYLFGNRFGASVFVREKEGNGSSIATFAARRDERWYQHDRIQPLEYQIVGATLEWALAPKDSLSLSWSKMIDGYTVQNLDYSLQVQWTRYFD